MNSQEEFQRDVQKRMANFGKLMSMSREAPLSREMLAQALYEGTPHLINLAEKMARQYGKADAIPFYAMTSDKIREFWLSIADQIIEHSKHYGPNNGSSSTWNETS